MVAPMPPERTKAVAKAAGTRMPTRLRMFSVPPSSVRSRSTANARCSRSRAMSRRTSAGLRVSATVAPFQRGPGELRLLYRLLRNGWHSAADPGHADSEEKAREHEEGAAHDQEREP